MRLLILLRWMIKNPKDSFGEYQKNELPFKDVGVSKWGHGTGTGKCSFRNTISESVKRVVIITKQNIYAVSLMFKIVETIAAIFYEAIEWRR